MKSITILALCIAFFATPVFSSTSPDQGENMKEIIKNYFEAFNQHDVDALCEFYARDAVLESPEEPFVTKGVANIRKHYQGLFAEIPDVQDEVKNVVTGDSKIAIEFTSTGTIPGGKEKFELKVMTLFEIQNGKIVRDATYYDTGVFSE